MSWRKESENLENTVEKKGGMDRLVTDNGVVAICDSESAEVANFNGTMLEARG